MSCGAEPGSSGGASGGPGDEKDKDMNSSHRVDEPEDMEYTEAGTLTHSSPEAAYTSSEEDTYSNESGMEVEQSDSESEGATSAPQTSPRGAKESGRRRKNANRISYSDLSYLNSLSRQEKRRIEGEIIKGRTLGQSYDNRSTHNMFCTIEGQTMESQSLVSLNYT